jgi:Na+-translocating ferredoxin:NAD+ oxidoreductase RnfG subunit
VGKRQGKILGYAAIETETVRTKPETLMVVLTPEGFVDQVTLLAFHEPPEYQPPQSWFELFKQKHLAEVEFTKSIQGISGATLSTRSALNSVRKVLTIYQILVKKSSKP